MELQKEEGKIIEQWAVWPERHVYISTERRRGHGIIDAAERGMDAYKGDRQGKVRRSGTENRHCNFCLFSFSPRGIGIL